MTDQLRRLAAHSPDPCFLPIDPGANPKGPTYKDWPRHAKTLEQIERYLGGHGPSGQRYTVGLLLGPQTRIIDLEGDGPQADASREALLGGDSPTLAFRSAKGEHHLYTYDDRLAHLPSKLTHADYPDLEIRGCGTGAVQSAIPPTPPREWLNDLPIATLPDPAIERLAALRPRQATAPDTATPVDDIWTDLARPTVDHGKVWAALGRLTADNYDEWFRVGAALHSLGDDYYSTFDAWSRRSAKYGGRQSTSDLWAALKSQPSGIGIGTLFHLANGSADENYFGVMTSAELDAGNFAETWLIDDMLVEGQPFVIGGPEKVLKTSIICDAAISLASGKDFLGRFRVLKQVPTLVMTAESGAGAIQGTARRVATAKGVALSKLDIIWSTRLPQLDNEHDLEQLARVIEKYGIGLVAIDPAYLCLGGDDHGDVFKTGPLLRRMAETITGAGATPKIAHHSTKGVSAPSDYPLSLTDLSQAGFREWAGTWWLLNRRSEYRAGKPHELWLRAGSRSGDTYDYALDIYEGTRREGKVWRVDRIVERHQLRVEADKRELEQGIERVIEFLRAHPKGRALRPIAEAVAMSRDTTEAILNHLVSAGQIVAGDVPHPQSTTKTIAGYRLAAERQAA